MSLFELDEPTRLTGLAGAEVQPWSLVAPPLSWQEQLGPQPLRMIAVAPVFGERAHRDVPAWVGPVLSRLVELTRLPVGWDGSTAEPVSLDLVHTAIARLVPLMGESSPVPSVVPTRSGGVQLEWHEEEFDIEIVLSVNGPIDVFLEDYTTEVSLDGPLSALASDVRALLSQGRLAR